MNNVITILDNEEYLRQVSKNVEFNDLKLNSDIAVLSKFCEENKVFAMAAIQLGIPKRIIYLKNTNLDLVKKAQYSNDEEAEKYNEARILINPIVISREGLTEYWETCASCLDNMGLVERPYKIILKYADTFGNSYQETFEGFAATVLSHELDHLDGVLHMDKSKDLIVMPAEERKIFRQTHEYKVISEDIDFESAIKLERKKVE